MVTATRGRERKLICVPDEHPDTAYPRIPVPDAFDDGDFLRAKDIEAIAALLIGHYEGQFAHLRKLSIGYAWKRTGGAPHGSRTLGKTVKASGLTRYFSGHDFIIWLAADHLREFNDDDNPATFWQVEAIVYHEMMHVAVDLNGAPILRAHDFEGFAKEVTEYGAWDETTIVMRRAFKQMEMFAAEEMAFA